MADLSFLPLILPRCIPLLLAALGGLWSERSGVANIALEGQMLAGAFGAVVGAAVSGDPLLGCLCGVLAGALFGLLHAVACIRFRVNQLVSGVAVNLLALGSTGFLLSVIFHVRGSTPSVPRPPVLFIPALAVIIFLATVFVFRRTVPGLRIRAVGESPESADAAGIPVNRVRLLCVTLSGALCGLGGAYLSLADIGLFVERMTAGRGFLALAALIIGRWTPGGALVACLFFASVEALADSLQSAASIPPDLFLLLPYAATLLAVLCFARGMTPPAALGRNFDPEGQGASD